MASPPVGPRRRWRRSAGRRGHVHRWHLLAAPRILPVLLAGGRCRQGYCQLRSTWHRQLVSAWRRERWSPAWRAGCCWQIRFTRAPGICRAARWRARSPARWCRRAAGRSPRRGHHPNANLCTGQHVHPQPYRCARLVAPRRHGSDQALSLVNKQGPERNWDWQPRATSGSEPRGDALPEGFRFIACCSLLGFAQMYERVCLVEEICL